MIHKSKLFELVQMHPTFSLTFVAASGELVKIDLCRCTSWYSIGGTMDVKLPHKKDPITVNTRTITNFNGQEVFI